MVTFEKMWEDVGALLNRTGSIENIHSFEGINGVFSVDMGGEDIFITKKDFVDFWCRMLYFHEVSKKDILNEGNSNLAYVYEIVKHLPYVREVEGVLTLVEE